MLQSALTFTLSGRNGQLDPQLSVYQTVFLQGRTVTATIALSTCSQGVDLDRRAVGFAAAFITKAGIVTGPGRTDNLPLDPRDVARNQIRIPNCSYITFRLALTLAEAHAVATVLVEGGLFGVAGLVNRSVRLAERATGRTVGIHHVAYPQDVRAPSEALLLRRVRGCAAEAWGVPTRTLEVAEVDTTTGAVATDAVAARPGRRAAPAATPAGAPLLATLRPR